MNDFDEINDDLFNESMKRFLFSNEFVDNPEQNTTNTEGSTRPDTFENSYSQSQSTESPNENTGFIPFLVQLSPVELYVVAAVITVIIASSFRAAELDVVGHFVYCIGVGLITISVQGLYLQDRQTELNDLNEQNAMKREIAELKRTVSELQTLVLSTKSSE